ncbi:MAG: hypothetical protein K0S16_1862 [Moraxellaceae bacterium]|nr:hypothetical protein [Moraxellaceae bacterium]
MVVVFLLGRHTTQHGNAGTHDVHRVRRRRQLFKGGLDASRQAAQRLQLGLVASQLGDIGQLAMHQQVRDLLEFAGGGDIEDVVTAVMQVIPAAADGAQRGIAGSGAGQGHGLLCLGQHLFRHVALLFLHSKVESLLSDKQALLQFQDRDYLPFENSRSSLSS